MAFSKLAWQQQVRKERRERRVCVECGGGASLVTYYCPQCQGHRNTRIRNSKWWLTEQGRKKNRAAVTKHRQRLRRKVMMGYGGQCNCCGEDEYLFLELDHVNNDGAKDRGKCRYHTVQFFARIIRENFPDRYQVLCSNCNLGKSRNGGVCPHATKELPNLHEWESNEPIEGVVQ